MTQQRSNDDIRAMADAWPLTPERLAWLRERVRAPSWLGADRWEVAALLARGERIADEVREIAEAYLYDGDADQPLDDGYHALYGLAAGWSGLSLQEEQPTHLVGAGGWRACDTAADWAGSDTTGVTCAECLATTTDALLQEEQE